MKYQSNYFDFISKTMICRAKQETKVNQRKLNQMSDYFQLTLFNLSNSKLTQVSPLFRHVSFHTIQLNLQASAAKKETWKKSNNLFLRYALVLNFIYLRIYHLPLISRVVLGEKKRKVFLLSFISKSVLSIALTLQPAHHKF